MKDDSSYMKLALKQAKIAYKKNEVPVGSVLVCDGIILAKSHNLVEVMKDATAHAEMLCIKKASQMLGSWRLLGTTLYTTLEPCSMCYGAIMLSRVKRVVFAAKDIRHGACGSWVDLSKEKHPTHVLEINSGLYEDEASSLMKEFFQKRRHEKENAHICIT
ncbi:tRNA-specific adenosine deaminase [Candidatus Aerophobetes bacterium]|uniref:tRNA-specific adenosine deaminase n=1 Tax=Aerophobetes bacterium TaxID=2030807 RepID=A0A2A4YHV8_UNCAE|nr:MAG: tRNA-specific adenosine deaminase [Candidatus Aerophobetes bacterium]